MNKFKKILLGTLSVLTLGLFVATGAKVNAATVTRTYDFYNNNLKGTTTADLTLVANEENEDFECASTEDSTESMTLNIANNSNGTFRWKKDGYVEFQCKNNSSATLTYTFTTKGDATLASKINTGGGSKYVKYSIDNGTKTQFASGTTGGTEFSFDFVGAGEHTLVFSDAVSSSGSNMKIYSLTITDVYDTSSAEDQAVAAISAIGTVEYTTECQKLIAAATSRVNAVAEEKRNSTYISNYDTYTAAVTAFNTLETTAISTFTTAVTNIGEVTTSSGTAIETAEAAYAALIASTKENATVIGAKETLDAAKLAYSDALYDTLDKFYETPDSIEEATLTADEQLGNSIFTATTGMRTKDGAVLTIGSESWNTRYYTNGSSTCTTSSKQRLIYFTAKTSGTLKIAASSQNATDTTRKVDIYNESCTKIASISAQIADSNNTYIYVNIPSSGKYYIGSTLGVNFFYLKFIPETTYVANDVALTFEAQYNEEAEADSTKLRFIGTIEGIAYADYANIETMKFTFTFKDTARTASVNNLYKSIVNGETVLKAAADNKMYVIYQLNNINKTAYQGEKLSDCKFIITFTDGSTVSVNRADITLPTAFTTVVA